MMRIVFKSFPYCLQVFWHLHCSWSSMLCIYHTTGSFEFLHPSQYGIAKWHMTMWTNVELSFIYTLHFRLRMCLVVTMNTGNKMLYLLALHRNCHTALAHACNEVASPPTDNHYKLLQWRTINVCNVSVSWLYAATPV